jgi:hypothetical protein
MPKINKYADSEELLDKYAKFMKLRSDVLKAIEDARNEKIIGIMPVRFGHRNRGWCGTEREGFGTDAGYSAY